MVKNKLCPKCKTKLRLLHSTEFRIWTGEKKKRSIFKCETCGMTIASA